MSLSIAQLASREETLGVTSPLTQEHLFADLSDPAAFPGRPHRIAVVESDSSWLFVAGTELYKVRKSGRQGRHDLDDYKTRLDLCDEELRLNRRLSPELYLGVVPITRDPLDRLRIQGQGDVVGWAVQRSWLPERTRLRNVLAKGAASPAFYADLGKRMAQFHERVAGGAEFAAYADAAVLERASAGRLERLSGCVRQTDVHRRVEVSLLSGRQLEELRLAHDEVFAGAASVLRHRIQRDMIGDGHGALELDHVFAGPQRAWIMGCEVLEPSERFGDGVRDVLNLVIDLEQAGFGTAGEQFLEAYRRFTPDVVPDELVLFYRRERSLARALRSADRALGARGEDQAESRAALAAEATRLLTGITSNKLPPSLIWVGGLPGAWAQPEIERIAHGQDALLIDVRDDSVALRNARVELARGRSVLIAGGFWTVSDRLALGQIAAELQLPLVAVHAQANEADCLDRLNGGERTISDRNFGVWIRSKRLFEPPTEFRTTIEWDVAAGAEALDAKLVAARLGAE